MAAGVRLQETSAGMFNCVHADEQWSRVCMHARVLYSLAFA